MYLQNASPALTAVGAAAPGAAPLPQASAPAACRKLLEAPCQLIEGFLLRVIAFVLYISVL